MRDNKGQLLLLAVVFLAITLIVLASAATVFLNVKQNQMNGSFADEYDNIKEKFGFALNEKANQTYKDKYNSSHANRSAAVNDSFNKTRDSFMILLSYHGVNFDAKIEEGPQSVGQWWNVTVELAMSNEYSSVNETVKYYIWL